MKQGKHTKEAASVSKDITFSKFDASLDIDVRLGVETPRKANQMVRGAVSLPTEQVKVRAYRLFVYTDAAAAKEAYIGADYVGLDEYIEKINWSVI